MAVLLALLLVLIRADSASAVGRCVDDEVLQAKEYDQNYRISCGGIHPEDSVTWNVSFSTGWHTDCTCHPRPDPCSSNSIMGASRPQNGETYLTIYNVTRFFGNANLTCYSYAYGIVTWSRRCQIHVYSESTPSCDWSFSLDEEPPKVNITCKTENLFSSRGEYSCTFRLRGSENSTDLYSPLCTLIPSPDKTTYAATCACITALPNTAGAYSYEMVVSPGNKTTYAGRITMPAHPPHLYCASGREEPFVKEDDDLQCNCTASDLGIPQGRLFGYHGDQLLSQGSYGNHSLTFTLLRIGRAVNGTMVRCIQSAAWGPLQNRNQSAPPHVVFVAFGPTSVELADPGVVEITPTNPAPTVTLSCRAKDVYPRVVYNWKGPCEGQDRNVCVFFPTVSDNGRVVACSATNAYTHRTMSASRTLRISSVDAPRTPSQPLPTIVLEGASFMSTASAYPVSVTNSMKYISIVSGAQEAQQPSTNTESGMESSPAWNNVRSTTLKSLPELGSTTHIVRHPSTKGPNTSDTLESTPSLLQRETDSTVQVTRSQADTVNTQTSSPTNPERRQTSVSLMRYSTTTYEEVTLGAEILKNSSSAEAAPYLVIAVIVSLSVCFVATVLILSILMILLRRRRKRNESTSGRHRQQQSGGQVSNTSGGPYEEILLDSASGGVQASVAAPAGINIHFDRSETTQAKIIGHSAGSDGYLTPRYLVRTGDNYLTPSEARGRLQMSAMLSPWPCTSGHPNGYRFPCRSGDAPTSIHPENNPAPCHRFHYLTPCYPEENPPPYQPENPSGQTSENPLAASGDISMSPDFNTNFSALAPSQRDRLSREEYV